MTDVQPNDRTAARAANYQPEVTGWTGWLVFAGLLMLIGGSFSAITGLAAVFRDDYYVVASDRLVVSLDYTAWGWVHLVVGVLVIAAGIGVTMGQVWARTVGVILAALSAITNFTFLPAYPIVMTIVITIDVFLIYALIVHGHEARTPR